MADPAEKEDAPASLRIMTPQEKKKRDQRNLALALALGAFMVLVFLVTLLRLGGSVAERSF